MLARKSKKRKTKGQKTRKPLGKYYSIKIEKKLEQICYN